MIMIFWSSSWGFNWSWWWSKDPGYLKRVFLQRNIKSLFMKLIMVLRSEVQWNFPSKKVLNARHLKPPEVHRGTLSEKMGRASRLRAKSNINMTRSLHTTGISIYVTMFNINITRSQKNLDWVKSKFASLKANIHTQVNKSLLQQIFAAIKFQQLFAATK